MNSELKNHKVQIIKGNGFPLRSRKITPNTLCPCGSGKKVKKCHKLQTEYFFSKLTEKQKAEREVIRQKALEQQNSNKPITTP